MPLFYYLLNTAICNAYILSEHYRKSKSYKYVRGTHRAFREALIDECYSPVPDRNRRQLTPMVDVALDALRALTGAQT